METNMLEQKNYCGGWGSVMDWGVNNTQKDEREQKEIQIVLQYLPKRMPRMSRNRDT
jgi:hypothetical protein